MDRATEQQRMDISQTDRSAAFYDGMVRERSPYTGILAPPRIDSLSPWHSPSEDGAYTAPGSGPTIRRIHVIAALLVGVFSGAVALAALLGHSRASAAADEKSTVQSAAMAPSFGSDSWTQPKKNAPPAATPRPRAEVRPAVEPPAPQPSVAPPPSPAETPGENAPAEEADAAENNGRVAYDELLAKAQKGPLKTRIQRLRDAIAAFPEGEEAMARLAVILMERAKDRTEALSLATRAAELNADNAMAWLAIGYIHQMSGKPKEAREAYLRCAKAKGPQKFVRDCASLL